MDDVTTRVLLIQHAQTQWNVERRSQGHRDTPLNAVGRDMAERLAQRLMQEPVAAIYSSDLLRARETIAPFVAISGLPLHLEPRLREGRWAHAVHSDMYPMLPFPVESENGVAVLARMRAVMAEIAAANRGRTVVVVSHGAATRQFLTQVLHPVVYPKKQAVINAILADDAGWRAEYLGDDAHLNGLQQVDYNAG